MTTLYANIINSIFFLLLHRESYTFHPPRNTYNKALGFLRPRPNVELLISCGLRNRTLIWVDLN